MEGEQKSGSGLPVILGVILVLALIGVAWFFMQSKQEAIPAPAPVVETGIPDQAAPEARVPANVGNVDAMVDSLITEADADAAAMASTDADAALVGADAQAVSDLKTTYDSTAF